MAFTLAPTVTQSLKSLFPALKLTTQSELVWVNSAESKILQAANNKKSELQLGTITIALITDDINEIVISIIPIPPKYKN